MVYVLAITVGLSSTMFAITVEITPNYLLAFVMGNSLSFGYLLNFVINSVFLNILDDPKGRWILFIVLAVFSGLAFLFVWLVLPETAHSSVKQNLETLIGEKELRERRREIQGREQIISEIDLIKSPRIRNELMLKQNNYKL